MTSFDPRGSELLAAEARKKWGNTAAYKEHAEKTRRYSADKWNALAGEMDGIFAEFALCLKNGNEPSSAEAQSLVSTLQNHISANYYRCTDEILLSLGQMYTADERFLANIDAHASGTAAFVCRAIRIHCGK